MPFVSSVSTLFMSQIKYVHVFSMIYVTLLYLVSLLERERERECMRERERER